jgi:hypothetical protein
MKTGVRQKKTRVGALIGIGVVAAIVGVSTLFPLFQDLENKSYDLRYRLKVGTIGEQNIDDVVIVDIDDASLAKLGRFQNWPRLYHAKIAEYMASGGAAAIAFDIFFVEPDSVKPAMMDLFESVKSETVQRRLSGILPGSTLGPALSPIIRAVLSNWGYDSEFGQVAAATGRVYFPFYFSTGVPVDSSDLAIRSRAYGFPVDVAEMFAWYSVGRDRYQIGRVSTPVPALLGSAKGTGYYNIEPDID